MKTFKEKFCIQERMNQSRNVLEKYPNRIPVIVECNDKDLPPLDKSKYLVPRDITVGQFVYVIRKRIKLTPDQAIFLFINNTLPPTASTLEEQYNLNKDEDGFLYMSYRSESTFGSNQKIFG